MIEKLKGFIIHPEDFTIEIVWHKVYVEESPFCVSPSFIDAQLKILEKINTNIDLDIASFLQDNPTFKIREQETYSEDITFYFNSRLKLIGKVNKNFLKKLS